MRTLKQRTADVQTKVGSSKEKEVQAQARHERYLGHVKRLEEEVAAAKAHADQAAADLATTKRESEQVRPWHANRGHLVTNRGHLVTNRGHLVRAVHMHMHMRTGVIL